MSHVKSKTLSARVLVAIGVGVTLGALCPEAAALPHPGYPDPTLPPIHPNPDIAYYGRGVRIEYLQGVILSDPKHYGFTGVDRTVLGNNEVQDFISILDATLQVPSGEIFPATLTGPVTTVAYDYQHGQTGTFDTEILAMTLTGNVDTPGGVIPVAIRENPNLPSTGSATITDSGGGLYEIDSFFDVFTELSVDGGPYMSPVVSTPVRMDLCPEPGTMTLLALGAVVLLKRRKR